MGAQTMFTTEGEMTEELKHSEPYMPTMDEAYRFIKSNPKITAEILVETSAGISDRDRLENLALEVEGFAFLAYRKTNTALGDFYDSIANKIRFCTFIEKPADAKRDEVEKIKEESRRLPHGAQ